MHLSTPVAAIFAFCVCGYLLLAFNELYNEDSGLPFCPALNELVAPLGIARLSDFKCAVVAAALFHCLLALVTVACVTFFHAPYGRYAAETIVPVTVQTQAAWVLQEMPTLLAVAYRWVSLWHADHEIVVHWPLAICFLVHYIHRTLIFPLRIRPSKPTPVHVMLLANVYCCFNGSLQAATFVSTSSIASELSPPNLTLSCGGLIVFALGLYINIRSDNILIALRRTRSFASSGASGYQIPQGFLYNYVSCPNFFGECLEWVGFAVVAVGYFNWDLAYALAGFSFAVYTASNTIPRGVKHHQWYLNTFGDAYLKLQRKAAVPGIL